MYYLQTYFEGYSLKRYIFDFNSGNFTVVDISKNGRYSSKSFRCNSFHFLYRILQNPEYNIFNIKRMYSSDGSLYNDFLNSFDNDNFTKTVKETLGIDNQNTKYSDDPEEFIKDFTKVFTKMKRIKTPNNNLEYFLKKYSIRILKITQSLRFKSKR